MKSQAMTEAEFWELIGKVDRRLLEELDEDGALRPLYETLRGQPEARLAGFGEWLARVLHAIDGKVWAENAGISGTSDDGFLYARCYVVAQGRDFYEAIRSDPRRFPKSVDFWCEGLLYQHRHAWAAGTGREVSEWPFETSVSFESGSHRELWQE